MPWLIHATRVGIENTSSLVFDDCTTSPLSRVSIVRSATSTSSMVAITGPSGQNVSNDFDHVNCPVVYW